MPKATPAYRQIRRLLRDCAADELVDIAALAQDLADQRQEAAEAVEASARAAAYGGHGSRGPARKAAVGHVELKFIGNCGPYAYLRFWQGGRLKSKYIGKVKQAGAKGTKGKS